MLQLEGETIRPDGINFVFPVSRPTLQNRADPEFFFQKKFFFADFTPKMHFSHIFIAVVFLGFKYIN